SAGPAKSPIHRTVFRAELEPPSCISASLGRAPSQRTGVRRQVGTRLKKKPSRRAAGLGWCLSDESGSESRDEHLALEDHLLGQVAGHLQEQLLLAEDLLLELFGLHALQGAEVAHVEVLKPLQVDVLGAGHPAEQRLVGICPAAAAIDDPLQHAHVLAEAGPQEATLAVLAEPVHAEDARR